MMVVKVGSWRPFQVFQVMEARRNLMTKEVG